jgi:hypothetical protein
VLATQRGSQRLLLRCAPRNDDIFFVIASEAERSPEDWRKSADVGETPRDSEGSKNAKALLDELA